jgi:hypothetical protein
MTTSNQPAYKAPDGFYKSYTFDKEGNVFADGKQLSGVQLGVQGLKPPKDNSPGFGDISKLMYPNSAKTTENPYAIGGGNISRLSVDENGNVFAEIGTPNTPKPTGVGTNGAVGFDFMKGTGGFNFMNGDSNSPSAQLRAANAPAQKVQLSGITLDPGRTSRNSGGDLGDNQAYIRQDRDGLYFVQVNKGDDVVAYAYNKYQQAQNPVAGPAQPSPTRRQGGNAGGGSGIDTSGGITLLGS